MLFLELFSYLVSHLLRPSFLSFALCFSSTAVASKIHPGKGRKFTDGFAYDGILILQDVLCYSIYDFVSVSGKEHRISSVFLIWASLAMSGLVLGVMYLLAQRIIPILLSKSCYDFSWALKSLYHTYYFSNSSSFFVSYVSPAIAAIYQRVFLLWDTWTLSNIFADSSISEIFSPFFLYF